MALASAIITRIQQYGFGADSAVAQLEAVNEEVRELYVDRNWQWRETTGTATATVATYLVSTGTPTDLAAIISVNCVDGTTTAWALEYLNPVDFRRLEQLDVPAVSAPPVYWTQRGSSLRLFPRPDKAYSLAIDYLKAPTTDLTTSTEIPLPYAFEDIVVYGAVARLAVRQRDQWLAEWAYGKRNEMVAKAARDDDERQRQQEETVGQSPSRWVGWNER